MRLDEMIGRLWETDVTEAQVMVVTKAIEIRAIPHDVPAVSAEFVHGRVSIWLDEEGRIAQITHERRDGGFTSVGLSSE